MNSSTYPAAQHVMVLYTGGTIGMQASAHGLAPASGFEARMREYLHSQPDLVVPQWRFREMSPLIDSANMTPAYWQQLREAVVDAVDVQGCDSVLILHGTDTLAYSAAAMSFQLLGLHARVVFTGSMLPAGVTDSDAWENLSGALVALGHGLAPGVHLYFHGELLDPTRCAKVRSFGRHPFKRLERQGGGVKASSIPASAELQPAQATGESRCAAAVPRHRRRDTGWPARQRHSGPGAGVLRQRHRAERQPRVSRQPGTGAGQGCCGGSGHAVP